MKILALGDFHGQFPKKFYKIIKKEHPDIIVSNGDYMTFSLRKIFFKRVYVNQEEVQLWDIIGKKKYKEALAKDLRAGEKVLKILNRLKIPVVTITGNVDQTKWREAIDEPYYEKSRENWKWLDQDFLGDMIKKYKNIRCVDYSHSKFNGYTFIGWPKSSFPGRVKSKNYKKIKKQMERLFNKFRKENKEKKLVFVAHNGPYNTRLDLIKSKEAHKKAKGKHYGAKLTRRLIDKYQPFLTICGHIHEGMGMQKLGKTLVINTGSAHEGKAAIITLPENKGKIKVKFIK